MKSAFFCAARSAAACQSYRLAIRGKMSALRPKIADYFLFMFISKDLSATTRQKHKIQKGGSFSSIATYLVTFFIIRFCLSRQKGRRQSQSWGSANNESNNFISPLIRLFLVSLPLSE
jgi:hypothetical protein